MNFNDMKLTTENTENTERATPETDAHIKTLEETPWSDWVYADFARRLERERDEARSMTEHQWLLRVGSRLCVAGCKSDGILDSIDEIIRERDELREALNVAYIAHRSLVDRLKRERDEAREAFVIATDNMVQAQCKTREALRERDEAWEALMEIEDRCVDCEDACDDIQKIREIAVKALEGAK